MIGKRLSHYDIQDKIGEGGMGAVYRAHDTKLGRDVAIKVLPPELTQNVERAARFAREARTLASLQHPNIASVYGFEDSGEISFLVMELVEGEDLGARLSRGALSAEEAVAVARDVSMGLEAAHEQGIVHRDLKPANIQLGRDGTVKILDFGLARAYTGDADPDSDPARSPTITAAMTQAGTILGTAAYMSPEQARGKPVDRRADIWAFGVVLFEMLTAKRLFEGETASDTLAGVLRAPIEFDELPASLPPALHTLMARCLERDPRLRLRDIGEARLILDAIQGGDPSASMLLSNFAAAVEGPDAGPRPSPWRERAAWALAAAMLLLLAFSFWQRPEDAELGPPLIRSLSIPLAGEGDIRYSHNGLVISPDGSHLAYIQGQTLYIRDLALWDPITIAEGERASTPFWSPDGEWLAYGLDRQVWKVRRDGTQRSLICESDVPLGRVSGGAWLADGRIVFRGLSDLRVVSANGGTPTLFASAPAESLADFHEPVSLPGGEGLLTIRHGDGGANSVGIYDLEGRSYPLFSLPGMDLSRAWYSPSGHVLVMNRTEMLAVPVNLQRREALGEAFSVLRDVAAPSVSDDGMLVYVRGAGATFRQPVLVDRTGEVQARLGQSADLWAVFALSPDGRRALVGDNSAQDLWIHDERGARIRVTFTDIEHDMAIFTPDGQGLVFATGKESDYRLGRKSVEGNESEEVLPPAGVFAPAYYGACPSLSSDGKRLFYTARGPDDSSDIAWLDLEPGAEPQLFLSGPARELAACPAPHDARYVAYASDESGTEQVYLTTWPDAERRLQVSIEGGMWPRWKGDGSELYFARGNEIYAVSVSYDPVRLGRPEPLFSRPEFDDRQPFGWPATYDVTADGERFLVTDLVVEGDFNPYIAIVENWASTLPK